MARWSHSFTALMISGLLESPWSWICFPWPRSLLNSRCCCRRPVHSSRTLSVERWSLNSGRRTRPGAHESAQVLRRGLSGKRAALACCHLILRRSSMIAFSLVVWNSTPLGFARVSGDFWRRQRTDWHSNLTGPFWWLWRGSPACWSFWINGCSEQGFWRHWISLFWSAHLALARRWLIARSLTLILCPCCRCF